MKKFIVGALALIISLLPLSLVGCKDDDLTTIKINEVTDSVFYAPFYIAIEKGFFAEFYGEFHKPFTNSLVCLLTAFNFPFIMELQLFYERTPKNDRHQAFDRR